jgi:hypothetical protein
MSHIQTFSIWRRYLGGGLSSASGEIDVNLTPNDALLGQEQSEAASLRQMYTRM